LGYTSCSSDDGDSGQQSQSAKRLDGSRSGGGPAPGFTLTDLSGNRVSFSDYRGKLVLVDFWATWCMPCRRSIPALNELYREYSPQGFEIVGISLDRTGVDKVRHFAKQLDISYKIVMGSAADVRRWRAGVGIPVAFLVDRDGEIVNKWVGYQSKSVIEAEIRKYL
jgi:cytochrome c biogenesis protein CcmG/thiol:disulfide interchange protein DsbE